jgi:ribosomal protein S18 acetylase RimI-like enzyme
MIIRQMRIEELPIIIEIYRDTFKATHQEIVTDSFIQGLTYESALARLKRIFKNAKHRPFCYLIEIEDKIIGFAIGSFTINSPYGYEGELIMLYILPAFQQMGIGRLLVHQVAKHFEANNVQSMFVGSFKNNTLARKFYHSLGAVKIDEYIDKINGENFPIIIYGWSSIHELTKV